ncbi:histidine ammonia-lyase, partial [Citrobacter braakii]|nr:histidine ammonia-lyase [Citrobacter braakii]
PLRSSGRLEEAHALIRSKVPRYDQDRVFAPDIAAVEQLIDAGSFTRYAGRVLPSWSEQ